MNIQFGNYYLGQKIKDDPNLEEFDPEQYKFYRTAGFTRTLPEERIYWAEPVEFAGHTWTTLIWATRGVIYKFAPQCMDDDEPLINRLSGSALEHLTKQLGKYDRHHSPSKRFKRESYVWDRPEARVTLNQSSKDGDHCVTISFTSSVFSK